MVDDAVFLENIRRMEVLLAEIASRYQVEFE